MSTDNSSTDGKERDEPVKNTGQFVQHIAYWYNDGSIVIRVDNLTIYKIHLSMLMKLSEVMRVILTIPDGKAHDDPTREGSRLYPLFLPGTNAEEFNDFLQWLYRAEWESLGNDNEKERICTHLLKLSDMWDIRAAKIYAISILDTLYLPASRRLELAGKYTIPDWVRPAVPVILNDRLANLRDTDICAMGWKVYSILVNAMEVLQAETRCTALVPPLMEKDPSWDCQDHSSCLSVWPKLWFDRIGRDLLHPYTPTKLSAIVSKVEKEETLKHPRLSESCRRDMVLHCSMIQFADVEIVSQAAQAIIEYHQGL